MSEMSKIIDEIIELNLAPYLKQLGFKRSKRNFHLKSNSLICVINVQASQWNSGNTGRFTINVGRHFPAVAEIYGLSLEKEVPPVDLCTICERIGALTLPGNDHWWDITPESKTAIISKDVKSYIEHFAWPWLTKLDSSSFLLNELIRTGRSIEAASVAVLLRDKDLASTIASDALKKWPENYSRIDAWALKNNVHLIT